MIRWGSLANERIVVTKQKKRVEARAYNLLGERSERDADLSILTIYYLLTVRLKVLLLFAEGSGRIQFLIVWSLLVLLVASLFICLFLTYRSFPLSIYQLSERVGVCVCVRVFCVSGIVCTTNQSNKRLTKNSEPKSKNQTIIIRTTVLIRFFGCLIDSVLRVYIHARSNIWYLGLKSYSHRTYLRGLLARSLWKLLLRFYQRCRAKTPWTSKEPMSRSTSSRISSKCTRRVAAIERQS